MTARALLRSCIVLFTAAFLRPASGFGQSLLSQCHKTPDAPEDCVASAGGAVITSSNVPPGNTSGFSFTPKGGGGIYTWTRRRHSFDIGLRWAHISNANLGVNNPQFNPVQLRPAIIDTNRHLREKTHLPDLGRCAGAKACEGDR